MEFRALCLSIAWGIPGVHLAVVGHGAQHRGDFAPGFAARSSKGRNGGDAAWLQRVAALGGKQSVKYRETTRDRPDLASYHLLMIIDC